MLAHTRSKQKQWSKLKSTSISNDSQYTGLTSVYEMFEPSMGKQITPRSNNDNPFLSFRATITQITPKLKIKAAEGRHLIP